MPAQTGTRVPTLGIAGLTRWQEALEDTNSSGPQGSLETGGCPHFNGEEGGLGWLTFAQPSRARAGIGTLVLGGSNPTFFHNGKLPLDSKHHPQALNTLAVESLCPKAECWELVQQGPCPMAAE